MNQTIKLYYVATLLFLTLDYVFGINVRIAFLDSWPVWRLAYYGICFACLLLMILRPSWAAFIGAIESLTVIVALTLSMALRAMIVTDQMIESGSGGISSQEIINYLISGSIAYLAWFRGVKALKNAKIV